MRDAQLIEAKTKKQEEL